MIKINQQIEEIEIALDEKRYRLGSWQKLVEEVEALSSDERAEISGLISELGNKLHQRHGFQKWTPSLGQPDSDCKV